jgi:predicted transcriptional regulator
MMTEMLVEMAKDLVLAQIAAHQVTSENITAVLASTHQTLCQLHSAEAVGEGLGLQPRAAPAEATDWKRSITKHAVTCLECGATFKQLAPRHLQQHDLDPRSYRDKYGIPRSQALAARASTARRKQLAMAIRPWERAQGARQAAKPAQKSGSDIKGSQAKAPAVAGGRRKQASTKP